MPSRAKLLRLYWFLSVQLGFDPLRFVRALRSLPRYFRDLRRFRAQFHGKLELFPCLHDWHEEGGSTSDEYFWQDLLAARKVFAAAPQRHVDIGSRVDGFLAHVASFREVEVFDVRPISASLPGVTFRQADLSAPQPEFDAYCDSLSCLHALEHFGLGRYGDPLSVAAFGDGMRSLSRLLRPGGTLYLSMPIGIERIEFNAQRVMDPRTVLSEAALHGLQPREFTVIKPGGRVQASDFDGKTLAALAAERYSLGMFVFNKSTGDGGNL